MFVGPFDPFLLGSCPSLSLKYLKGSGPRGRIDDRKDVEAKDLFEDYGIYVAVRNPG
jgi:hypothetical protein